MKNRVVRILEYNVPNLTKKPTRRYEMKAYCYPYMSIPSISGEATLKIYEMLQKSHGQK